MKSSPPPTGAEWTDRNQEPYPIRGESFARRWIIWRATIALIAERPLLGYGPETFATLFNEYYPPGSLYAGQDALVSDPHNQFLAELFAAGILGVASKLLLLGLLVWKLLKQAGQADGRQRRLAAACLGALAAHTVQAQFNPDVVTVAALFWIIAAVGIADSSVQAEAGVFHFRGSNLPGRGRYQMGSGTIFMTPSRKV